MLHQTSLPQGGAFSQLGHQHQAQRPDEGGGQAEHGQGHAAQHAEGAHGLRDLRPRVDQPLGDEHRGGRAHQVAQQAGQPDGDSDGGDAAVELPVLQRRAGQAARPVQMPPGQQEQGNGGEQLAQDHAGDNQPHRPLRVLGEKDHQQPQHRSGADELFTQLHRRRRTDVARAVEEVFVQVLHPGEQDAGQQEQQAQLGAGVPQQIDRDGVVEQDHHRSHRRKEEEKYRQAAAEHLGDGGPVAPGVILGGEVGHCHRQTHGGEGHDDGEHRHDELVQPHDLRADQPGEQDAVHEPEKLGDDTGAREDQGTVEHRGTVEFQGAPSFP